MVLKLPTSHYLVMTWNDIFLLERTTLIDCCMYIYIYIYIYMHAWIHIHTYRQEGRKVCIYIYVPSKFVHLTNLLKVLYTLQIYKLYQACLNDSLFRKLLQHIRGHCINTSRRKWPFLTHPSTLMRLVTFP